MRVIRQTSFTAVPWKNGGGVTHEAIRVPPSGDPFQWRVSIAEIGTSGPFSDFAGYHRFMVLLRGAGVVLRFSAPRGAGPEARDLRVVGDLVEFDGALATHCDLVDGACVDLNLMVSNTLAGVSARVEVLRQPLSFTLGRDQSMLALPIDSGVELSCGSRTSVLARWDLALLSGSEDPTGHIAAHGGGEAVHSAKVFLATLPLA